MQKTKSSRTTKRMRSSTSDSNPPARNRPTNKSGPATSSTPAVPEGAVTRALFIQTMQILGAVLSFEFPADAVLSRHFRDNRELGHRDRGFIAEAVYGVLRRLRWLRRVRLAGSPIWWRCSW